MHPISNRLKVSDATMTRLKSVPVMPVGAVAVSLKKKKKRTKF